MPGIDFGFKNMITFFSMLSPIFITTFLLLDSALNVHLKGVIYVIGLLIAQIIGIASRQFFPDSIRSADKEGRGYKSGEMPSSMCKIFNGPYENTLGHYRSPSDHGIFHLFTLTYLIFNPIFNSMSSEPISNGWGFVVFIFITAIIDFYNRVFVKNCERVKDILFGCFWGLALGAIYFFIINAINPKLTYFNNVELENKKCKTSKQKFKCSYN